MRRETQNILLVLLGGALLKLAMTGTFLRYVKPSHKWLLIAAGAVVVLLALVSIGRDLIAAQRAEPRRDQPGGMVEGHAGHRHASSTAWLLLLPVLAVFLVAPPALGADSVQRAATTNRSAAAVGGTEVFPPLPKDAVLALPMSEFSARAAWDSGHSLDDRQIRLTGFVVHDRDVIYLARLAIACCAADAFPVKVRLADGPELGGLGDDTWVEAVVTVQPGSATKTNDYVPSATVVDLTQVAQPEDPYEH
ncbi:MAG: TIGR03943 family putative permease subunit [Labedaea sp.]